MARQPCDPATRKPVDRPRMLAKSQDSAPLKLIFAGIDRAVGWRLLWAIALAAVSGAMAALAPLALKHTVDAAVAKPDGNPSLGAMAVFAGAYLLCLCLGRLVAELKPGLSSAVEQELVGALRLRFFRHVLGLPLSFHVSQPSGTLAHTLQQGILGCQVVLFNLTNGIVPVIVEGATVAAVLISLRQPALTLTFVITAMTYGLMIARRTSALRQVAQRVLAAGTVANSILTDSLTNVEPIKAFGAERPAQIRYGCAIDGLRCRWVDLQRQRTGTGLAATALFAVSMSVSLVIAIDGVSTGRLTLGGFVLATVYLVQILRPLEMIAAAARDLAQGLAFIRPLAEVFDLAAELEPSINPGAPRQNIPAPKASAPGRTAQSGPATRVPPSISFRDIHFAYAGGKPVLNGLNLDIPAGRSLAIVGASGCGKSSLVRLLLRLYAPQAGRILLDDVDIDAMPIATLRAAIAVVPQDTVLLNSTIAANIAIGKETATMAEIEHAAGTAGLEQLIAALPFGYDTQIGERGLMLSGGVDVDPRFFGETAHPDLGEVDDARDTTEFALLKRAIAEKMPIFGICRGIQVLNVAMGGTLYQHLPDEKPGSIHHQQSDINIPRSSFSHPIQVDSDTRLRSIVGTGEMQTNSFHHQAVRIVAPNLMVTARAADGVIEAVEAPIFITPEDGVRAIPKSMIPKLSID